MADYFVNKVNSNFKTLNSVKKVLLVGLTCIDIINECEDFPVEDEDAKVLSQTWSVGGNAANTARVLAQHDNIQVDLFCGLSQKPENSFVISDLLSYGVNIDNCCTYEDVNFPTSCCILNSKNGSRTILHCNHNFPGLKFENFKKVDVSSYDLVHFGGRDLIEVSKMIDHVISTRGTNSLPIISGEMEKPKRIIDLEKHLRPKVDVLFISKDIRLFQDFQDSIETLKSYTQKDLRANCLVCPWGDKGAGLAIKLNNLWSFTEVAPFFIEKPVDTLGAGDVFIAGTIYGLICQNHFNDSVQYACFLAKEKCLQNGFKDLLKKLKKE